MSDCPQRSEVRVDRRLVREAVEELTAFIDADGDCDHSVGICYCDTIRIRDALAMALDA